MDLDDPGSRDSWREHLAGLFAGRKVVGGVAPLAALNDLVAILARSGAQKPLLVYADRGAGPVPSAEDALLVEVRLPAYATMTEEVRDHDRRMRELPEDVRRVVDDYDPERRAIWCVAPFTSPEPIDGRAVVGARPPAWAALEDKIVVDEIWDAVGFPRADRRVAEVSSPDELERASGELDRGSGVVWVGDARDGLNGGGEFTRWVVTPQERSAALDFFKPRCDRVRVTPFLDGVPCSIHGIVLPNGTAAFRPVELAILRGEGRRFVYGGQGTTWDPPRDDREQMRGLVRSTGELLRERVGYRGGFGIDGVLTAEGFRPTELNPRFSVGLTVLARALDYDLFQLLQLNLTAGRDPGVSAADLEAWAVPALDERRIAQPRALVGRALVADSEEVPLRWSGRRLHRDEAGPMRLVLGPMAVGTFVWMDVGESLGAGQRVGPLNAAMMHFLDEELGAGFGRVEAAPDVRVSHRQKRGDHDGDVGDDLTDADLLGAQAAPGKHDGPQRE